MKKLLIIGAGGHGRVVADTAQVIGAWEAVCFLDDKYAGEQGVSLWPIVGASGVWSEYGKDEFAIFVALGDNKKRLLLFQEIRNAGYSQPSLIHPAATVSPRSLIGEGCILSAGVVVNVGASVADAVIINTGATIDHDCQIGKAVHISPGANLAGGVCVGEASWVGIGACVKQNISIGKHVIIGAGAAVVADIIAGQTVVGVPASPIVN